RLARLAQHVVLDLAHDHEGQSFDRADDAGAVAGRALVGRALHHAEADTLRLISIRPKWLMRPTWIRARSFLSASLSLRSTARLERFSTMSMKSMTMRPARSRRRSWRAISSAASRLVWRAVSSM